MAESLGAREVQAVRWQPGDEIVLRYITRQERPGMSWPARVVEDRDDRKFFDASK